MSQTIEQAKAAGLVQINVVSKPIVLVQIAAIDGDIVYLTSTPDLGGSTKVYGGNTYQAKLQNNVIGQIQAQSPQGYDIPGSLKLEIADGDFTIWGNHAGPHCWRGGTITVLFGLWDAVSGAFTTNFYTWPFLCDKPNIDCNGKLTVSGTALPSLTRNTIPGYARQNRCNHTFPTTAAQRADGLNNPFSDYYGCGYSPDQAGGVGNTTTPNLTNPDGSPLTDANGVYVTCDLTRSCGAGKGNLTQGCMARLGNYSATTFAGGSIPCASDGDIIDDESGRRTGRFDGDTWIAPVSWTGTAYTNPSAGRQYGFNTTNAPTGNTYYTEGFGTQWVKGTVLSPAGDPNSDRAEVICCVASVSQANILKVLVNDEELSEDSGDALFTYHVLSLGGRSSTVNVDSIFNGQGDPHGGKCWIEVVVPAELAQAGSLMDVQVLLQFPQCAHAMPIATATASGGNTILTLPAGSANPDVNNLGSVYVTGNSGIPDGAYSVVPGSGVAGPPGSFEISGIAASGTGGAVFYFPLSVSDSAMIGSDGTSAANPIWALMHILLFYTNCTMAQIRVQSWFDAAQFCAEQISYTDINGNSATHARYRCSAAYTTDNLQTIASAVLGLRNCAGLMLSRDPNTGLLDIFPERTLADQQPATITGSNYNTPVSSVTASGAAANGYLAFLFDGAGSIEEGTFKITGRSLNDTPNIVSVPFQDSANQWVQDSGTTVDPNGYLTSGNTKVIAPLKIAGIENFDQLTRRSNTELGKGLYGNKRFDAGGTDFYEFRASVDAAHLAGKVGMICGIKFDQLQL